MEELPESHKADLKALNRDLEEAGARQALERCHHIPNAPTDVITSYSIHYTKLYEVVTGGDYELTFNNSRNVTDRSSQPLDPLYSSELQLDLTQPP